MIIFMSSSGESLPIAWRMKREGAEVGVYIHNPQYRRNYKGLVDKVQFDGIKKKLKEADVVIFDITRPNTKSKEDIALLKIFGIKASSPSVFGPVADELKKHTRVIGASELTEDLELDRHKGIELAEKMGFAIPEMTAFKDLNAGAAFLKGRKDLWVFKPENNQDLDLTYVEQWPGELHTKMTGEFTDRLDEKCDYILQKKIDGAEISSEIWAGGAEPVCFNQTIESKKFLDGDLGLAIGSQSNTVWTRNDEEGVIIEPLKKMAAYLQKNGYTGPIDANVIIKGGVPYFLEWSPRFGYDALYCLLTLLNGKITTFLTNGFRASFDDGYAVSQRLSIPPYPYGHPALRAAYAKDAVIKGRLRDYLSFWAQDVYDDNGVLKCAGADGILGVVTSKGKTLNEAWGRLYNYIKKIKVNRSPQYRTDGFGVHKKRIEKLKVA